MKLRSVEFLTSATAPRHYPPGDRPEIAFAGRSNVGKSSLLNSLVGRKRLARVSKTPGRTQLINFFDVNGEMYLVDLPGYGYAKASESVRKSWGPMMSQYFSKRESLKGTVLILDIRRGPGAFDQELLKLLQRVGVPPIIVLTKRDKLSRSRVFPAVRKAAESLGLHSSNVVVYSSVTGEGRDELWNVIAERCALTAE